MELRFHHGNLAKHNVTLDEVEEAINEPKGWTQRTANGAYLHIGKTLAGRVLEIGYRELDGNVFVFHAMNAREHQKKRYKKRI